MAAVNTLHCFFDPLCGWCYAAAPLIAAAREVHGLTVALHAGGTMTGRNRRLITPKWRKHVMPHNRRIARCSGQPFSNDYFDRLLNDNTAMMDSAPPTTAILAAEQLDARGVAMLLRVQHAHYVEALHIADTEVLAALAEDIGLDRTAFDTAFADLSGTATEWHFAESRALLREVGGRGFPTFALQRPNGRMTRLGASCFLGQPDAWAAQLIQMTSDPVITDNSWSVRESPKRSGRWFSFGH